MMRTLSSAGSVELVPGGEPNVKEILEGGAGADSRGEEASASDVRSMIVSSTFRVDALGVCAVFTHQGTELDIFETGYDLEHSGSDEKVAVSTNLRFPEVACSLREAWHCWGGSRPSWGRSGISALQFRVLCDWRKATLGVSFPFIFLKSSAYEFAK